MGRVRFRCELDRFTSKVLIQNDGCLRWNAAIHPHGYGVFTTLGRNVRAHRWYFEHVEGPIPEGLMLDHLCRVRACVNPAHLRAVTAWENVHAPGSRAAGAVNAARTHCKRGHLYRTGVLSLADLKRGRRRCRACANAVSHAHLTRRRKGIVLDEAAIKAYADRKYAEYTAQLGVSS